MTELEIIEFHTKYLDEDTTMIKSYEINKNGDYNVVYHNSKDWDIIDRVYILESRTMDYYKQQIRHMKLQKLKSKL